MLETGQRFEDALGFIRVSVNVNRRSAMARKNWRGHICLIQGVLYYFWPSGVWHVWAPTNEDLCATDWEF